MTDVFKVPESLFMFFDTIVSFDHFFQVVKVITYLHLPDSVSTSAEQLSAAYDTALSTLNKLVAVLQSPHIPEPAQPPIKPNQSFTSNIGQSGYETHVHTLKKEIQRGNIIQAVPSHRISRPTSLHPFNVYRQLRTTNPSPYLFYISCKDFHLVGASPELLIKKDPQTSRIITHPIAGTVKRGRTYIEDEEFASQLRASLKDRAEHVMLVDLARNDINRICEPTSTRVDRLMVVEKFSHVQHLVSQVSGLLRTGQTRFDAFRSIFPAGTVSGAPKVRAMELIAELEKEKRGIYAGAVGYFGFGKTVLGERKDGDELVDEEGAMDTCIALRTMMLKDGVAYLQAGGGIVWDSEPEDEWHETMNKLAANIRCIGAAEERYSAVAESESDAEIPLEMEPPSNGSRPATASQKAHVEFGAAG